MTLSVTVTAAARGHGGRPPGRPPGGHRWPCDRDCPVMNLNATDSDRDGQRRPRSLSISHLVGDSDSDATRRLRLRTPAPGPYVYCHQQYEPPAGHAAYRHAARAENLMIHLIQI